MSDLILNNMVDGCGITRELSSGERHTLAGQIGAISTVIDLTCGDLINQECKALGLPPIVLSTVAEKSIDFSAVEPLAKRMGYTLNYAAAHAEVARAFPRSERAAGLSMQHYKALQGMPRDEKCRQILLEAAMGYQKPDGSWAKPHPVKWVKTKRQAVEGKPKSKAKIAVDEAKNDIVSDVVPEVAKAIGSLGIDKRKAKAAVTKVEKAIVKTQKVMEKEYSDAVNALVDEKFAKYKASFDSSLKVRLEEADATQARYEKLSTSYDALLTKKEHQFLVQFCHPDKFPPEMKAKAEKASRLLQKLKDSIPDHVCKQAKQDRGWA